MRILVVTPWTPDRGGGLERYATAVATRLQAADHEVALLAHGPRAEESWRDGLRVVTVPPGGVVSNTPLPTAIAGATRRLLRETRADVLHVHTPVPGPAEAAAFAARREGIPFVVTYHAGALVGGTPLLDTVAFVHRVGLERWMLKRAAARLAVSPFVQARVFRRLASRLAPPGVDLDRFSPEGRPSLGRILFVGPVSRAYSWKGFRVLFEAFARMAPGRPEATLDVVGEGDLVAAYEAEVAARGLQGRVRFRGRLPLEGLVAAYRDATVVALPSTSPAESFGMVLAEASACGRPVVGARMGGIPFLVQDGETGLLVPPGDPGPLATALGRLLDDPGLADAMGAAGRARVAREFRWEATAARTEEALEDAYWSVRDRRRKNPAFSAGHG